MAACAWFGEKKLLACSCFRFGRTECLTALPDDPLFEIRRIFGHYKYRHVRMLKATKFRALSAIDAGPFGADREIVVAPGNQILLARQAGHPERMNYVCAFKLQAHIASHRNV